MGIEKLIEGYIRSKYSKASNTKEKYRNDLNKFNNFIVENNIDIKNIKLDDIISFYISIEEYAVSTKNGIKITVSDFIKYLVENETLPKEKLSVIGRMELEKVTFKQEKYLNNEQIDNFLDFLHNAKKQRGEKNFEFTRTRDRFLFELLINRGLRATETTLIEFSDIDGDKITISGAKRKNKEDLEVYLDESLMGLLDLYLVERDKLNTDSKYLLVKANGREMFDYDKKRKTYSGANELTRMLQLRIKQVNILNSLAGKNINIDESMTIHCLRHSCSYRLQTKGFTLQETASVLGQSSLTSTIKYEHINSEDLRKKFNVI